MTKNKGEIFTPETEEENGSQNTCPNCQMPQSEWSDVEGFEVEGVLYCCEGCAENIGCTCGDEDEDENENDENDDQSEATVEDTAIPNRDAGI